MSDKCKSVVLRSWFFFVNTFAGFGRESRLFVVFSKPNTSRNRGESTGKANIDVVSEKVNFWVFFEKCDSEGLSERPPSGQKCKLTNRDSFFDVTFEDKILMIQIF